MAADALIQRMPLAEIWALARGSDDDLLGAVADLEQIYLGLMRHVASELATWDSYSMRQLSKRYFPHELDHARTRDRLLKRLSRPVMRAPMACVRALSGLRGFELLVELAASLHTTQGVLVDLAQALQKKSPEELRLIAQFYNVRVADPVVTRILAVAAGDMAVQRELVYWLLPR